MKKSTKKLLVLIGIIFFSGLVQADLNNGLIAYYPFEGNANDLSGNGNNGTENGSVSYVLGQFGQSVKFDNSTDYITVNDDDTLDVTNEVTMSLWVKPVLPFPHTIDTNINGRDIAILLNKEAAYELAIWSDGTVKYALDITSPNWKWIDTGIILEDGKWVNLALVYNGSQVIAYLNNKQLFNKTSSGIISLGGNQNDQSYPLGIGARYWPSGIPHHWYSRFTGEMDELRIYNRALSKSEIQELYNEGSTPNTEESVATLSENLNIHIPELDYKINYGEVSKLDIYLSSVPSQSGNLTWQLDRYSNSVCSNTANSCSSDFQVAIASSNAVSEHVPFDIHIPTITYKGSKYWADLAFAGSSNDKLLWQLDKYGVSENNNSNCNFPYESLTGFDRSVNNPTCLQKWNLYNYQSFGTPLIRYDYTLLYAQVEGVITQKTFNENAVKVTESAIEIFSLARAVSTKAGDEAIAGALTAAVSNNLTRYISSDDKYLNGVLEIKGAITSSILAYADKGGNPIIPALESIPKAFNIIQTFYASRLISEITEKLNESNISEAYLHKFYQLGSNTEKVAVFYTQNRSSSLETIIAKIAQELSLKNTFFTNDYNDDKIVEIITHYRDSVIPNITASIINK